MKKKLISLIIGIIILALGYTTFLFAEYQYRQNQNKKMVSYCSRVNSSQCKGRMLELLLPNILVYNAKINKKELELIKLDSSRIDSKYALENADVSFGYGIYNIAEFEEAFAEIYDKYSYAFDCGVHTFETKHPKCLFYSECIATDKFLIFDHLFTQKMQTSSGNVHTLAQKIKELNLENKKIFVKMDIGEATFEVIPELVKYSDNVAGVNIGIGFHSTTNIIKLIPLLKELNKKYVLIHCNTPILETNINYSLVNSKYYKGILNTEFMYLSYINKNLVDSYKLRICQNTDKIYKNKKIERLDDNKQIPLHDVSIIVTITEKIKELFNRGNK